MVLLDTTKKVTSPVSKTTDAITAAPAPARSLPRSGASTAPPPIAAHEGPACSSASLVTASYALRPTGTSPHSPAREPGGQSLRCGDKKTRGSDPTSPVTWGSSPPRQFLSRRMVAARGKLGLETHDEGMDPSRALEDRSSESSRGKADALAQSPGSVPTSLLPLRLRLRMAARPRQPGGSPPLSCPLLDRSRDVALVHAAPQTGGRDPLSELDERSTERRARIPPHAAGSSPEKRFRDRLISARSARAPHSGGRAPSSVLLERSSLASLDSLASSGDAVPSSPRPAKVSETTRPSTHSTPGHGERLRLGSQAEVGAGARGVQTARKEASSVED